MNTARSRQTRGDNGNPTETLLTLREACRLLNVHGNTLRRWSTMGLIKAYRVGPGHHRRFKTEDVAALAVEQSGFDPADATRKGRNYSAA